MRKLNVHGDLWLGPKNQPSLGDDRIALLEQIGVTGSITRAAKAVGISYKTAWDTINALNNLCGSRLVETTTGGKGGGGAKLSRDALKLIQGYRHLEAGHKKFLSAASTEIEEFDKFYKLFKRLLMKTSARNQFFGKVTRIVKGSVNAEVELKLSADDKIVSIVTKEGLENLGLKVGREAWALVKASSVILAEDRGDVKLSARNCLRGTVTRVTRGAVNSDVTLTLPGGTSVNAIITNVSLDSMGLKKGSPVCAVFKASSVILGVSV